MLEAMENPKKRLDAMAASSYRSKLVSDHARDYPMAQDLYNLFWVSNTWSLTFWYVILCVFINFILYGVVAYWLS